MSAEHKYVDVLGSLADGEFAVRCHSHRFTRALVARAEVMFARCSWLTLDLTLCDLVCRGRGNGKEMARRMCVNASLFRGPLVGVRGVEVCSLVAFAPSNRRCLCQRSESTITHFDIPRRVVLGRYSLGTGEYLQLFTAGRRRWS